MATAGRASLVGWRVLTVVDRQVEVVEVDQRVRAVLLELAEWRGPLVQNAIRESAIARRDAASASIEHLFSLLGLRPRIPAPLLAEVVVAFIDGLAIAIGIDRDKNARAAFDVFWLSLLSLTE